MPEGAASRVRITATLRCLEAARPLASGEMLTQISNDELLEVERWVALILLRVRAEIADRGLN